MRKWFDMMVWLEDIPPVLEVGEKPCVRCRSLLKSRRIASSPPLGSTARLQVDRMLEPLMKKHGCDVRYLPPVNRYPECLRPRVAKLLCGNHISGRDGLPTCGLLDNIFVSANDPWVVVGIILDCDFVDHDADLHNRSWHKCFSSFLRCSLQLFDMPVLPRLSSTGRTLCRALDNDYSEERSFGQFGHALDDSDWVKLDRGGRQLRLTTAVTVAVTTFLRNKKDVNLRGCRRCQTVCMEFFAGIPSTVGFEVADSSDRDNALVRGLSSPLEGPSELGMQEPDGMEAFTNVLRTKPTLSGDEIQSRVTGELRGLKQYLDSFGLDILNCLQRSDSGNRPSLR
ncbi:hypothetical protein EDD15DRAFT_318790 [Pisolithus albus]|nr:hypothetical protein EDD15DRAFT_318790 [Pisolithus albus]